MTVINITKSKYLERNIFVILMLLTIHVTMIIEGWLAPSFLLYLGNTEDGLFITFEFFIKLS